MALTGIVLCGGRSSRMGRDKSALPFGDETMLDRIVRIVRNVADEVIIVGRRDQQSSTIHDAIEDQGPLAGVAAGLGASHTDLNIVVACDMPLIRPAVLEKLVSLIDDYDICVATIEGRPSVLCGVYRSSVATEALTLFDSGERRVMRLLDRVKTKRVDAAVFRDIDPELDTFLSVDTPEKYDDALKRSGLGRI